MFRRISLHVPCRTGIPAWRRVRDRLRPPPSSLPVQRLSDRPPAAPEQCRDSAGCWRRAHSNPNQRPRLQRLEVAFIGIRLCWQFGRFGFALHSPSWKFESESPGLDRPGIDALPRRIEGRLCGSPGKRSQTTIARCNGRPPPSSWIRQNIRRVNSRPSREMASTAAGSRFSLSVSAVFPPSVLSRNPA